MPRERRVVDYETAMQLHEMVKARHYPVLQLAKDIPCNRSTLQRWLHGINPIPPNHLARICDLIHLSDEQRHTQFVNRGYAPPPLKSHPVGTHPLHQLRPPLSDFVGRDAEIAQIVTALTHPATTGIMALICGVRGMGGVGKTELATMAAHQLAVHFPDAQIVVDLHDAHHRALAPEAVLQQLVRLFEPYAQLPNDSAALQGLYRSLLHNKRVLILADNVADANQIEVLVPPLGSALLVTSRQRLVLRGSLMVDLNVLSDQAAMDLVCAICSRLRDTKEAHELATLCGNLPLALWISARFLASDDTYPIARYLSHLHAARLEVLRDRERPDDPTVSVEASLAVSYTALRAPTQDAFTHLSVFPSTFDHAAIAAVLQTDHENVQPILTQLRWRHLIEWNSTTERGHLHDLVREFGLLRLRDVARARERHAQYFLDLAERSIPHHFTSTATWIDPIAHEHANFQTAMEWFMERTQFHTALRLAVALGPYWIARDHLTVGITALETILARVPPTYDDHQARGWHYLGMLTRVRGFLDQSRASFAESRRLFHGLEDEAGYAETTFQWGLTEADAGEKRVAERLFAEALQYFTHLDTVERVGVVQTQLGRMALDAGDLVGAQRCYVASDVCLRMSDDMVALAHLRLGQARLADMQHRFVAAEVFVNEALYFFEQLAHSQGRAWAMVRRGIILLHQQRYDTAHDAFIQGLQWFEQLDNVAGGAFTYQLLAELALAQGDTVAARKAACAAIRLNHQIRNRPGLSLCLLILAYTAHAEHAIAWATQLLGAVDTLLEGTGYRLTPEQQHQYDTVRQRGQAWLPPTAWQTLWEYGHALTLDDIITCVSEACVSASVT